MSGEQSPFEEAMSAFKDSCAEFSQAIRESVFESCVEKADLLDECVKKVEEIYRDDWNLPEGSGEHTFRKSRTTSLEAMTVFIKHEHKMWEGYIEQYNKDGYVADVRSRNLEPKKPSAIIDTVIRSISEILGNTNTLHTQLCKQGIGSVSR